MKKRIDVSLPTVEANLAGLDPELRHPKLRKVRAAQAEAEAKLEKRRAGLAALEQRIAELPDRVVRGESSEDELIKAISERDAARLIIEGMERAASQARELVAAEEHPAREAVLKEIKRREAEFDQLEGEVNEVLEHIGVLRMNLFAASQRASGRWS